MADKKEKEVPESGKELPGLLVYIQSMLKAPKNQYNSFGKYHYRSCEDILEALKPLLAETGLELIVTDRIVQIGERYYVEATAILTGKDGRAAVTAYAREPEERKGMDPAQVTGATSSYARKYALNGLFLIDDAKDADHFSPEVNAPASKKEKHKEDKGRLEKGKKAILDLLGQIKENPVWEPDWVDARFQEWLYDKVPDPQENDLNKLDLEQLQFVARELGELRDEGGAKVWGLKPGNSFVEYLQRNMEDEQ